MKSHHRTFAAVSLIALVTSMPAFAQETASTEVEEILVTAQLRELDPIEVPIALTAYSGDFLDSIGVQEFEEVRRSRMKGAH